MSIAVVIIGIILFLLVLALILFLQAKFISNNAIRLPEAIGERICIENKNSSLLHIGESTVAGVGVDSIEEGLTFSILRHLTHRKYKKLDWEILGLNGAKIQDSLQLNAVLKCPDILILTFGVNDTKSFTSTSNWIKNTIQCVDRFSCNKTKVYFTSVPPMHKFPLLPAPLRYLLGMKAKFLDNSLKKLCTTNNWIHIQPNIITDPAPMAEDGFHPNKRGYKIWGEIISEKILLQQPSNEN